MTTSRLEARTSTWDDARDGAFFRLTARLFSPAFCAGAGVLLGSYDDEQVPVAAPAPVLPARVRSRAVGTPVPRAAGA